MIVVGADATTNAGAVDTDLPTGALRIGGTLVPAGAGTVNTDLWWSALAIGLTATATAAGTRAVDTGLATRTVVGVLARTTAANTGAIDAGLTGSALVAIGAPATTNTGAIDADLALIAVAVEATRPARDAGSIDTDLRRCALSIRRATRAQRHALPIDTGLIRRTRRSIRAGNTSAHITACAALPAVPPCLTVFYPLAAFEAGVSAPLRFFAAWGLATAASSSGAALERNTVPSVAATSRPSKPRRDCVSPTVRANVSNRRWSMLSSPKAVPKTGSI